MDYFFPSSFIGSLPHESMILCAIFQSNISQKSRSSPNDQQWFCSGFGDSGCSSLAKIGKNLTI